MVSWGDGEESSTNLSSGGVDSLNTMYDSDYCGLDDGQEPARCNCHGVAAKFVCYEGCYTGRRFLGCAGQERGGTCDFVHWVDEEWPRPLQKAVCKLWDNYGEEKQGRVNDALDFLEQKFKLQNEIKKLNHDLKMVQIEVDKVVEEKQITLALKARAEQALIDARSELEQKKKVDDSTTNMHKAMRTKAEQDSCKLKEEKKKLEYIISDLLKQKEGTRAKMRKIKEICEE
ncbi:unnamed protein product [Alopecurus aequalis]